MQKRIVLGLMFIVLVLGLNAQIRTHYIHKNLRIHTDTCVIDMVIIEEEVDIKTNPILDYYWYKNRKIFSNQGGIAGNVMDGTYKCFSKTDQLLELGEFKMGLKNKSWKKWDANGKLLQQQEFKKGRLHGESIVYKCDGSKTIVFYKNGVVSEKRGSSLMWWQKENNDSANVITVIDSTNETMNNQEVNKKEEKESNIIQSVIPEKKKTKSRRSKEPDGNELENQLLKPE